MQLTPAQQNQELENNTFYYKLIIQGKTSNPKVIDIVFNYFKKYPELFNIDTSEELYPDFERVEPVLPEEEDPAHVVFIRQYRKPKPTPPKCQHKIRAPPPRRRNPYQEESSLDDVPYDISPYDD